MSMPLEARFWAKVDRTAAPGKCWLWTASRSSTGYGLFAARHRDFRGAHCVSWELANDRLVPKGKCVLHTCDVRACVNPRHLFIGTRGDNARDSARKGRWIRKNEPRNRKLTVEQVRQIRSLRKAGWILKTLAKKFGVSTGHVWRVTNKRRWRYA